MKDYHQVTDEIQPDWDLSGAVQDVQLLEVGYQVANADKYPEWKAGNEFKPNGYDVGERQVAKLSELIVHPARGLFWREACSHEAACRGMWD